MKRQGLPGFTLDKALIALMAGHDNFVTAGIQAFCKCNGSSHMCECYSLAKNRTRLNEPIVIFLKYLDG